MINVCWCSLPALTGSSECCKNCPNRPKSPEENRANLYYNHSIIEELEDIYVGSWKYLPKEMRYECSFCGQMSLLPTEVCDACGSVMFGKSNGSVMTT